jgi:3-oxoacyl-[acyl-carrier protein] reductase
VKLNGKNALITGASKGLGQAMAMALAADGVNVGLVSRDVARLHEVAGKISAAGGRAEVFTADVADEAQVARVRE